MKNQYDLYLSGKKQVEQSGAGDFARILRGFLRILSGYTASMA
jgi:hypothetical protein